jgi:phage tail sheath protein FI
MAEYTYPGIYIEEIPGGPGPISGVSTSSLGLIGFTAKGEVNKPILCTSFPEFVEKFGTFTEDGLSPTMAYAFFANGGQRLYFVRVTASDADEAYVDYVYEIEAGDEEDLGNDVEASGIYNLQLDHSPVVPGSVTITFNDGATDNVFTDAAGDGVLTKTSGAGAGGSGSIDYATGEVNITLANPANYSGGANHIEALYTYTLFRFQMKWPGLAGDYYRVRIQPGSSDFLADATASWRRFTILVEGDVNMDSSNPNWTVLETFADLVMDDPNSSNYITTVINNTQTGSDIIEVIDYGNEMNPPELQGVLVTAEDFSATQERADGSSAAVPDPYDGLCKGWQYDLANGCFPTTFNASFQFQEGALYDSGTDDTSVAAAFLTDTTAAWAVNALVGMLLLNTTDGSRTIVTANTATTITGVLVGGSANVWNSGDAYELRPKTQIGTGATPAAAIAPIVSPGNASAPAAITPSSVAIYILDSVNGLQVVVDDGTGKLMHPDGAGPAVQIGTINYTTGQIADLAGPTNDVLNLAACTSTPNFVAGSAIYLQCQYATPVSVIDDGDGNLALNTTQTAGYPQKFTLDAASDNLIDYDTGEFSLYWQLLGAPTSGPSGVAAETATYYTQPEDDVLNTLANGSDGTAVASSDIISPALAVDQAGLYAFGQVDELMQLVASDFQTDVTVSDALITYAELMKDKFVILTVPHGLDPQEAVNWKKFQLNRHTSYAALYYPHIKIMDPVSEVAVDVPCGGHIAGVYARTDANKNVGKAPAGTEDGRLNWSVGLELDLTPTQVGVCNPEKINCLVQWPHTGRCVWGARSLDIAGGEWPFIQMRRLFMFLEKSVFRATHAHVFKNNGPALWSAIQTQITNFLLGLYQAGYFAGNSPDQAFFVICDRTNNPQNTVDQGIVFCDIGVAPNKPAEFIVFRFQQKALA